MMQSSFQKINQIGVRSINLGVYLTSFENEDRPILRRFTKNFCISFIGSLFSCVIGLGRIAVLTKSIAMVDYGKILIVINLFSFLGSFLEVRVNDVIYKLYPKFEEQEDVNALSAILFICLGLSLMVALVVGGGVFFLATWIADRFYQDSSLTQLFKIYSGAVIISSFGGVSISVLRLHDRFASIVIPQALGGAVTLATLFWYFYASESYDLEVVIVAFVLGVLVQTIPPMIQTMRIVRPYLLAIEWGRLIHALQRYRHELVSTFFQTNLAGYLKLVFSPGDLFLLGIFSTFQQVALYGIARSLTNPLLMLQNNIQIALTPEVTKLWAKRKLKSLNQLIGRYVISAFILGCLSVVLLLFLARPITLWISSPAYLESLPIFYALIMVVWLTLMFLIFYPIGLCMDMLKWYNRSQVINITLLVVITSVAGLNALNMAYIQLAGTVILRLMFSIPVWLAVITADKTSGEVQRVA